MALASERMKRVTVIGPLTLMDRVVKRLYALKAVHIKSHVANDELDIGSPAEKAGRLAELLVGIRGLLAALGISGRKELMNGFRAVGVKSLAGLESAVNKLNSGVAAVQAERKAAEDELKRTKALLENLSVVKKLGLDVKDFGSYATVSYIAGIVADPKAVNQAVLSVTDRFEFYAAPYAQGFAVALFFDSAKKKEIAEAVSAHDLSELQLNGLEGIRGLSGDVSASLTKKQEQLEKRVAGADKRFARFGVKWHDFLLLSDDLISKELEKAEAPLRFGVTGKAFVVTGWVPVTSASHVEDELNKVTKKRIFVELASPHHSENAPVKLDNPKAARPFEFFLRLYALPRYGEIDPTLFTFFTFPLFFGIILGDVGYGLVAFFLALWVRDRFPSASSLAEVILPASISSILFGFLFGEVFGFEQFMGVHFPHLISRAHEINAMLAVAVVIGLLHINLGFVLGFLNELRHHGIFRAFASKLSWVLLQAGVALAALSYLGKITLPAYVGVIVALASVVLIYLGESLRGIVELPALLSNVLSYARLMAVGLSSVSLAVVVNELAIDAAHAGGVGTVFAVIILFFGHAINIALGLLGGFLHSLRLHYVEFFTKFFEGGGIPFRPFGSKN